ncbi:ATP-grasp domain-containing protein [Prevotella melaninogenica]|uniref:ATP-grasp domain-containing protein n=1 Tax=Prevotella melaninogenica TaxID=28132 RepID=UPI001BAACF51|nr:ATP-grasp domain-containing protein [Prevotella melaninogenica]QUB68809.1 ATP-grasp domain-containing protein [Prevotella melaninogenica]
MKNIMFCSCGRRVQLFKFFKESLGDSCKIIATDVQSIAPALYAADEHYLTPRIDAPNYVDTILKIAIDNEVKAITTLIDPEIELLAKNRDLFEEHGIIVLAPSKETAAYCFDKYKMFCYLKKNNIRTVLTYDTLEHFKEGHNKHEISFPVFIKPRTGSGSVGIHKCSNMNELENYFSEGKFDYIIQEFMDCEDCDADVYIDCYSHKPVAAFSKNKLETKIGGASKTISFKDQELFDFIEEICKVLEFNGPVDMDFWYKDGQYYLSEVNPRFGGAYLHAYGSGVDFFKLIQNNMEGNVNESIIGKYDDDVLMMMYDSVVIISKDELVK